MVRSAVQGDPPGAAAFYCLIVPADDESDRLVVGGSECAPIRRRFSELYLYVGARRQLHHARPGIVLRPKRANQRKRDDGPHGFPPGL
jgi:hypothetical protein